MCHCLSRGLIDVRRPYSYQTRIYLTTAKTPELAEAFGVAPQGGAQGIYPSTMTIGDIARSRARLEQIVLLSEKFSCSDSFVTKVIFHFEGNQVFELAVDNDNDELIWNHNTLGVFETIGIPESIEQARGLWLTWSWEMRNQQGYFDALQLELTDKTLSREVVLQFKVSASRIEIFELIRAEGLSKGDGA
jgi:hypothetical protein